ncbi:MAG: hypothetical protein IPO67_01215 [Deltaproteobacteria bacterium]|nr:hypothetical protein [Deltaproteobacteria bacterium]
MNPFALAFLAVFACARIAETEAPTSLPNEANTATAWVNDPRGGPPVHPGASPLPPFGGVSRATARYVGAAACAGCHPQATAVWASSAHATAWDTLNEHQRGYDPSCIPCHVTGFGHPGGFVNLKQTPDLKHLGCESCHGPGSDHLSQPEAAGYGDLPVAEAACVACHTGENSPDFTLQAYWPLVSH